jgi:hypothetical protein
VSQAGFWVPRALAFEHRLKAAIADPGVVDVSTAWLEKLPAEMVQLLDDGDKDTFDKFMTTSTADVSQQELAWRAKPYGSSNAFDAYKAVEQYRLGDLVTKITTPLLITDPEGEQFWPGQSQQLYEQLQAPKTLVKFTADEGADRHCQPMGRALTEQRVFDWLDELLRASPQR